MKKYWNLKYWNSGEWQVVEEKLHDLDISSTRYCPGHGLLFNSLKVLPETIRVVVLGQDPYPDIRYCTGRAFDIPSSISVNDYPSSLKNIFKEYVSDLEYSYPSNGSLQHWVDQGVLLWNVYPSCEAGKPGSHHWMEWTNLTKEILEKLNVENYGKIVFVFLGSTAASFQPFVDNPNYIITSHPSPLGARFGFLGSQIFSRTNEKLRELGQPEIDWKLNA